MTARNSLQIEIFNSQRMKDFRQTLNAAPRSRLENDLSFVLIEMIQKLCHWWLEALRPFPMTWHRFDENESDTPLFLISGTLDDLTKCKTLFQRHLR
jgi:hypothetical protein